jgi:hypothetical protein
MKGMVRYLLHFDPLPNRRVFHKVSTLGQVILERYRTATNTDQHNAAVLNTSAEHPQMDRPLMLAEAWQMIVVQLLALPPPSH